MSYNRLRGIQYAQRWALERNPGFYNFDAVGGDCTSFVSQCVYAGAGVMNYTPDTGWYYRTSRDRAAGWTGVSYLHNFLMTNEGPGPYGSEISLSSVLPGDVVQLSFDDLRFSHSLYVVKTGLHPRPDNILVCAHSMDSLNRPLDTYTYMQARGIRILGVRA